MEQKKIEDYISDEANDSELYRNMAEIAPDAHDRDILMKMSDDETGHMRAFQQAYHNQFNKYFAPKMHNNKVKREDYGKILRERILEEAGAYRMYARDSMDKRNLMMYTTLTNISRDENVHAEHLIYLLWKLCGCGGTARPAPFVETMPLGSVPSKDTVPPAGAVPQAGTIASAKQVPLTGTIPPPPGVLPAVPTIDCNSKCDERLKIMTTMARAWEQHIWWTRNLIISILAEFNDEGLVTEELLKNPKKIADIYEPYYGKSVADTINKLISEHLNIGGQLITAVGGDKPEDIINKLNKQWYANADEIAKAFAGFNPHYKENEVKKMMYTHLDYTTSELLSRKREQHSEEIRAFNKVEAEANGMADYFANGIIKDKICVKTN